MNAVVKINVNKKALISNLKMAFSTGTTWVTELLQNARRAGATEIRIVIDQSQKSFTIWDNGRGIEDMQHLFLIAESGWDEPILSQEKPYGMGFLSCLFACEKVHIISHKQQAKVVTKDAIALDDIHVEPHHGVEGTFIRMEGVANMPSEHVLQSAVKGFPVPVYLNQAREPLESIHAVDALDWVKTEVGLVHIDNLGRLYRNPTIYLQGLPIYAGFSTLYADDSVVVHLDPEKFFGRLPDRASVIDPDEANLAIRSAINKLYAERLAQKKNAMLAQGQGREFVKRYGSACLTHGRELLNDVPYLPTDVTSGYIEDLSVNLDQDVLSCPSTPVGKQDIVDGTKKLFAGDDGRYDPENIPHMALIDAFDGIIVDTYILDAGHWVHAYVHRLKGDIRIAITEQQSAIGIDGRFLWDGQTIVIGDILTLSGTFEFDGVPIEMGITYNETVFDAKEQTFYVPNASSGYGAVRQASDYMDDDVYNEEAFDEDDTLFARLVSEARNPDPAALLLQLLLDLGLKKYASINGKSFHVAIAEDGAIKVTLA